MLDKLTYAGREENLPTSATTRFAFGAGIEDPEAVAEAMAGAERSSTSPPRPTSTARSPSRTRS